MGEVIPWPKAAPESDDVVLCQDSHQRPVATLTPDGRVSRADDLDEASETFWSLVEDRIREHWSDTTIPRLQAQVRLLAKTLDAEAPGWKDRLRSSHSG